MLHCNAVRIGWKRQELAGFHPNIRNQEQGDDFKPKQ
jgi:hypothetical protein